MVSGPAAALSLFAGIGLASLGAGPCPIAALLSVAVGLVWGRRCPLLCLLGLGLGLLNGGFRGASPAEPPSGLDLERPVEVAATAAEGWRPGPFGFSRRVEADWIRQGDRVQGWSGSLRVTVPRGEFPGTWKRLRLKGFLRRTVGLRNEPKQPAGPWRLHVKSTRFVLHQDARLDSQEAEWKSPDGVLSAPRRQIEGALESLTLGSPGRSLVGALVLGDRAALGRDLQRGLARLGLSHLLAVSGLHVGILGALIWLVARPLPRFLQALVPLAAAALYLILIGPRPSLVRAAVMVWLAAGSLALRRPPLVAQSLSWAVVGILLLDPAAVRDLGFLLTISATGGIALLSGDLTETWKRLPLWVSRPLATSVAAQLGALPWTLPLFHLLTPAAPILNLLAVPWTALALSICLVWCGVAVVAPGTAVALSGLLDAVAQPYDWCRLLPASRLLSYPLVVGRLAAWLTTVLLAYSILGKGVRSRFLALCLAVMILSNPLWRPEDPDLEVVAMDVGQGEAILLRQGNSGILVDGGGWQAGDIGRRVLLPVLTSLGVNQLDAVLVSHRDLDHCRGLNDLAFYLPVREVWAAPGAAASGCVADLIRRSGIGWRPLWRGRVATAAGWRVEVLHPSPGVRRQNNDSSLVVRATAAGASILLTGDIEAGAERAILGRLPTDKLAAAVLKVAHHGSKTSTTERFVDAVAPRIAIISSGRDNRYGHPAEQVLERLTRRGVVVRRTDQEGMIRLSWPPGQRPSVSARL